ncbi:hypothetical protein GR248_24295 [Rhizobium leguminosarum]|nr:hypothetical protein [Rhizobium leguminosarum]
MRHELNAREYKLLLNPARFREATSDIAVSTFWEERLKPAILNLGHRDGEARHDGQFGAPSERIVRFWETSDCLLTRADLALRERLPAQNGTPVAGQSEITLKLRMPDLFVVAATVLPGRDKDARTTFEEDIAPLEVDDPQPEKSSVIIPVKRSIRSRFSLSTTQVAEWGETRRSLGDVRSLFPTVGKILYPAEAEFSSGAALVSGPTVREVVFKGARVKLGDNIIGKFTLTLWHFGSVHPAPTVAEISFKCALVDGDMPGKAARRALALFVGMQTDLGNWINSEHSSKTALALPGRCGRPIE